MTRRQQDEINRASAALTKCFRQQKAAAHLFSQAREDTRRAVTALTDAVARARGKEAR